MPNWCRNTLIVRGPEDALERFHSTHARLGDDGYEFTFGGSVPVPKVLRKIVSGGATIDGEHVKVWWERGGQKVRIADRTLQFLVDRYGATNWYDWSIKNWGTKWDAGQAHFDATPGRRIYEFSTAWGPPAEWARAASEQFPALEFSIEYEEPGMCFAGGLVVAEGAVLVDERREYEPEEIDE